MAELNFEMDVEVLECVLKKWWKESSVRAVLSVESSPAVGKNENLLSVVTRLKAKVVLGNGRVTTRSFIVKDSKYQTKTSEALSTDCNAFKMETMIYNTVIKEMENLMEAFEDTRGVLWCQLIHQVPYSRLVLEDLNASGFTMIKKKTFCDLDHTLLMVDALGRYHAMAKVLEERGLVPKDDCSSWSLLKQAEMVTFWVWNTNAAIKAIKKYWSPVWGPIVDRIIVSEEFYGEKLHQIKKAMESEGFKVLNHGDCHIKNIMFKHDWKNRPIAVRFLDFQFPHYSTPCCDLTSMVCLGADPAVRRANLDLILKTYHNSLMKSLAMFNYGGSKPSLQEIKDGMNKLSFLQQIATITTYASNFHDYNQQDIFNFEKVMASGGMEGYNLEVFKNPDLEKVLGPEIKRFAEDFFFKHE